MKSRTTKRKIAEAAVGAVIGGAMAGPIGAVAGVRRRATSNQGWRVGRKPMVVLIAKVPEACRITNRQTDPNE